MDNEMSQNGGGQNRGPFNMNDPSQKQPPAYIYPSPYPNTQMQPSSNTYIPSFQPASRNYNPMVPSPSKFPNTKDQPASGTYYPPFPPGQIYDPVSQAPFNMYYIPPDPTTQGGQNAALSANSNIIVSATPVSGGNRIVRNRWMKIGTAIVTLLVIVVVANIVLRYLR